MTYKQALQKAEELKIDYNKLLNSVITDFRETGETQIICPVCGRHPYLMNYDEFGIRFRCECMFFQYDIRY